MPQNLPVSACIGIILLCIGFSAARADGAGVLSKRIGDEIDMQEREYFGLFPEIGDFHSASVTQGSNGGAVITIVRNGGVDTNLVIGAESVLEFRKYIEDYEDLFREQRQLQWKLLEGLVGPSLILPNLPGITVVGRDGREYSGQAFAVSDSALVLWNGAGPYNWRELDERLVVLSVRQIEHIEQTQKNWYWTVGGTAVGGVIGLYVMSTTDGTVPQLLFPAVSMGIAGFGIGMSGNIDMTIAGNAEVFHPVAQQLQRRIEVLSPFSPELQKAITLRLSHIADALAPPPVSVEDIMARYPHSKFHFGAEELISTTPALNKSVVIDLSAYGALSRISVTRIAPVPWAFFVEYSLLARLRIGTKLYVNHELGAGTEAPDDYVSINTVAFTTSYEIVSVDPLLRSRFELLATLGLTNNSWRVVGTESGNTVGHARDTLYASNGNLLGSLAEVRLGYYGTHNCSMYLGFTALWVPKFMAPHAEDVKLSKDFVREHPIDVTRIGMAFGVQFHL